MKYGSPRYRFWLRLHLIVNWLAWKTDHKGRRGYRGTRHPVWALNNWVADHYTDTWLAYHTRNGIDHDIREKRA
jgi:hypothetical protein